MNTCIHIEHTQKVRTRARAPCTYASGKAHLSHLPVLHFNYHTRHMWLGSVSLTLRKTTRVRRKGQFPICPSLQTGFGVGLLHVTSTVWCRHISTEYSRAWTCLSVRLPNHIGEFHDYRAVCAGACLTTAVAIAPDIQITQGRGHA